MTTVSSLLYFLLVAVTIFNQLTLASDGTSDSSLIKHLPVETRIDLLNDELASLREQFQTHVREELRDHVSWRIIKTLSTMNALLLLLLTIH